MTSTKHTDDRDEYSDNPIAATSETRKGDRVRLTIEPHDNPDVDSLVDDPITVTGEVTKRLRVNHRDTGSEENQARIETDEDGATLTLLFTYSYSAEVEQVIVGLEDGELSGAADSDTVDFDGIPAAGQVGELELVETPDRRTYEVKAVGRPV